MKHNHNRKSPISFTSCTMTFTKQNSCSIQNEHLNIMFACKTFHQVIYVPHFVIENDHKFLLKEIFSKPFTQSPPRIRRFILFVKSKNFELIYMPGRDLIVDENLSCIYLQHNNSEISETNM